MSDPSQKLDQKISEVTTAYISSQELGDGITPSISQDGDVDLFGAALALVSPSARRGKALSPTIRATFGLPFSSSSKSADLQSSLESKLLAQMDGRGSILFSLTWKDQHTASGRRICALLASGRRTSDSDSTGLGTWPTPRVVEVAGTMDEEGHRISKKDGTQYGTQVSDIARLASWQTPSAGDHIPQSPLPETARAFLGTPSPRMREEVASWPTPNTPSGGPNTKSSEKHTGGMDLDGAATLTAWPTPRAGESSETIQARKDKTGHAQTNLTAEAQKASWNTPNVMDSFPFKETPEERKATGHQVMLCHEARLSGWPTPIVMDAVYKTEHAEHELSRGELQVNSVVRSAARTSWETHSGDVPTGSLAATENRGQLNPSLSRWLMGYPISWDVCSLRVERSSLRRSSKVEKTASVVSEDTATPSAPSLPLPSSKPTTSVFDFLKTLAPEPPVVEPPAIEVTVEPPAVEAPAVSSSTVLDALSAVLDVPPVKPTEPSVELAERVLDEPGATAAAFKARLEARGHRLLLRDGKFLVSEASRLTDEDRAQIKVLRPELIAMAEPWAEPATIQPLSTSLFEEPKPAQTLAQFLGSEPPRHSDYVPDEPPDLTGIDEVILNFATTGLDWAGGHRPCGVTVSTLDGKLCRFLPFAFAGGNLDEGVVKRWAQEQLRSKKITNAKTKFDVHHAREWGIDLEAQGCTFSDIQHTAALLDDHRKKFSIDLIAKDYLAGEEVPRVDEGQHHRYHAEQAKERELYTARLVGRLRDVMYPEIEAQELRAVHNLEDAVIPTVVEMEKNGSPIDEPLLAQLGAECDAFHGALMMEISKEAGFAFEHTANGWQRLIESLHLPVPDSFSESVLTEVDHPLIRKGQRASQYASLNSKIFKAYPEHIVNGLLRYNINQLASDEGGTVSGRFSIGLVQQVPNADNHEAAFGEWGFPRRLFVPGSGDYLEADAAQIEFRLLVHYSQNAKLLQAYKDDPEMSFHRTMQTMLQQYKPDMLYGHTKNYNFAAQYGAKSIKLAVMMGFITEREGNEIRAAKRWDDPRLKLIHEIEAAYKRAHPEAGALLDRASHLAKMKCDNYCKQGDALHRQYPHRGYVKTLLGRRSRFPTNYKTYIGLNRILQGTSADIMKQKLVELHAQRKETGFVMRITNHDAVLGDSTTPETLGKVSAILNAQSFALKVPILWKCGTGRTWAACK